MRFFVGYRATLFSLEQRNHEKQQACADDGGDDLPYETALLNADEAHEPAAEETADNTDDNVDNQAGAATFHQLAGQPARHCADEQENDNACNVHSI